MQSRSEYATYRSPRGKPVDRSSTDVLLCHVGIDSLDFGVGKASLAVTVGAVLGDFAIVVQEVIQDDLQLFPPVIRRDELNFCAVEFVGVVRVVPRYFRWTGGARPQTIGRQESKTCCTLAIAGWNGREKRSM